MEADPAAASFASRYASQTHASKWWIVRFPHQRRFEKVMQTIRELKPRSLLDWGAGDALLFQTLHRNGELPDCLAAKLRPGNVHSAEGWEELLLPEIERQQRLGTSSTFRPTTILSARLRSC